jgi:penicillin-binding protein 1B
MSRRNTGTARPRRRKRQGRRARTSRLLAGLLLPPIVVGAGLFLYLYVEITTRFEGKLWTVPSKIYSAPLVLEPGAHVPLDAVARRLDRSGYARAEGTPERPGQYRRAGSVLDVHLRGAESPGAHPAPQRVRVRFEGSSVSSVRDGAGRWIPRAEIEPELLATFHGARQSERVPVRLTEAPDRFVDAVLAAEDARFRAHRGIDLRAILRAAFANLRKGRIVQGGSTITQQTVKNLYLGQQRSWWRKLRELPMALILDARYPKERILEVYLNVVYLGQRGPVSIVGVQTASRFYFGRDLSDLTLAEQAMLAGMIRSPGGYNPFQHPERAVARRNQVLDALREKGWAEASAVEAAVSERLQLASGSGGFSGAPWVVDVVRAQLLDRFPGDVLEADGLRVMTSLDTYLQEQAEAALRAGLQRLERDAPRIRREAESRTLQGSVVVVEPGTGAVLALVGGRDYRSSQFNRAVQAKRQPGSCFKPFVYVAAFEAAAEGSRGGLTLASLLDDSPLEIRSGGRLWRPENYDGLFRGPVTARIAVENSLNVPTVRAAQEAGLRRVVEAAERCGIPSGLRPLPSLALGAQEVSPLDLAGAYATLAAGGRRVPPSLVREVQGVDGQVLDRRGADADQVLSPAVAWLVTDALRGVLLRGTGASAWSLGFPGDAAGKTGTTDDTRDAWFVGYTPDLVALVWVGYDDNAKTGLSGATGALPIWVDLMRRAGGRALRTPFREPAGVEHAVIDPESGGLAEPDCPARVEEVFLAGTAPGEPCPLHARPGLFRWFRKLFGRERERPVALP